MKKFLTTISVMLTGMIAFSQINYSNNQFSLTTFGGNWPLITTSSQADSANPKSAFIFEYGDGYFTTNTETAHIYKTQLQKTTVLSLSGRYDTIKPPPRFAKIITSFTPDPTISHTQQILTGNNYITVTPIAQDLNVRDEMLFIITYKLPVGTTNARIIFFYNQQEYDFFHAIDGNSMLTQGTGGKAWQYPRIRYHYKESSTSTAYTDQGQNLFGRSYSNSLGWNLNCPFDTIEHNIFVSIPTKDNLPVGQMAHVDAALLYHLSDTTTTNGECPPPGELDKMATPVTGLQLPVIANPHDPNYIRAVPGCITVQNGTKKVKYKIHFQNEGAGEAFGIDIKVVMDPRLAETLRRLDNSSFTPSAGTRPGIKLKHVPLTDSSFMLQLSWTNTTRNPFTDKSTLSNNQVPFWFVNPATMGEISFSVDVPTNLEADFKAWAGIFFRNSVDSSMAEVRTGVDTLYVRESCTPMLYPIPPPIIDTIIPPSCTNCNCSCKKLGPLCWYWWLLIGGGTIIIIWAIIRRRRKKKEADDSGYQP